MCFLRRVPARVKRPGLGPGLDPARFLARARARNRIQMNHHAQRYIKNAKTKHIQQELFKRYPESNNDYLLILMLLRVYRYTQPNTNEQTFIIEEIKKLWK